ncbi:MAG: hypothetical protein RL028_399, partial [Actinomycetota bacterium]
VGRLTPTAKDGESGLIELSGQG